MLRFSNTKLSKLYNYLLNVDEAQMFIWRGIRYKLSSNNMSVPVNNILSVHFYTGKTYPLTTRSIPQPHPRHNHTSILSLFIPRHLLARFPLAKCPPWRLGRTTITDNWVSLFSPPFMHGPPSREIPMVPHVGWSNLYLEELLPKFSIPPVDVRSSEGSQ